MLDALTLLALGLLGYTWGVYPALVTFLAARRSADRAQPAPPPPWPPLAVLLSAYNEEAHIAARIGNLLALDYPVDRLVIHVGIDGATDRSADCAREAAAADGRVFVHAFPCNRGKVAVLKDLMRLSGESAGRSDIVVFTDANTEFRPDALKMLARRLGDPRVGGVCGRLVFVDRAGCETQENAYWRWENRMKAAESALDSCLGANGAIYAVRRERFWEAVPDNTVIDDFVIGMKVRECGARVVYEPDAVAREELPAALHDEWVRRVRIGAGGFQAIGLCRRCLSPRLGLFAWMFWSHKVLRWFTPHMLLLLAAASVSGVLVRAGGGPAALVAPWNISVWGVGASSLLLAAALLGRLCRGSGARLLGPFRGVDYFLVIQAALFAGFLRFCRGGLTGSWQRTRR